MSELESQLPWGACRGPAPRDPAVDARLVRLAAQHGPLVPLQTYDRDPVVVIGHDVVVHLASGPAAEAQLRREAASREWAHRAGVHVPASELLDATHGPGCSLVSARVASDPGADPSYSSAAIDASWTLQSASSAPPAGGRTWRAARRTRPIRAARAVLSPLRVREARFLRDAVAALPADGWAHGDYRTYNVLYDAQQQRVHLVDWEYAGRAWRGSDLLALWACLDQPEVADVLLEAVLADRGPNEAPDVGLVLLWSAVRILAEQVTGSRVRDRDRARVARVKARVSRARTLARELGTEVPGP